MPGLGEDGIDLSFEDLEFTQEEFEEITEEKDAEVSEESEGKSTGEGQEADGSEEETQQAKKTAENNDEAAEGDDPDRVGAESAEGDDAKQSSPELYHSLAATLIEKGVLSSVDESSLKDVKDIDQFVELMKEEIKHQEFSDLSDTQKEILTGMREGASEATVSKFKDAMDKLDKIDDDLIENNENARRDLIYQDYLSRGFSKERALKQTERSFKLKEDVEDAKESFANLKEVVKNRYQAEKDKDINDRNALDEVAKKSQEELKDSILNTKNIMDLDLPENTRKEIYDEMMKHVSINPETKKPENALMKYQRENPKEFSHKLYMLWKLSKGFSDLKYFSGKKQSSNVKSLESAIRQSTHVQGGGDPSFADDINTGLLDIDDIILPGEE